mgnify:CR=1 FL=1
MSVLDRVNSPKDLKKLNDKELEVLCDDIRELLINLSLIHISEPTRRS